MQSSAVDVEFYCQFSWGILSVPSYGEEFRLGSKEDVLRLVSERVCKNGADVFAACLGIDESECISLMYSIRLGCSEQTGYPKIDGEIDSESARLAFDECVNEEFLDYLSEEKGIDPEGRCEL